MSAPTSAFPGIKRVKREEDSLTDQSEHPAPAGRSSIRWSGGTVDPNGGTFFSPTEFLGPEDSAGKRKKPFAGQAKPLGPPSKSSHRAPVPLSQKEALKRRFLEAAGAADVAAGSSGGRGNAEAWEEARAKFDWLDPSRIRDAAGRRPGEEGYDGRTVLIPPDVLSRMSASQKQYWNTKRQYMDTILFFKVGKFYELYEVDAEVGHKELDWKLTVSGVGKCRQVGVPESGIDDAVQKLVARGYKVGRMEQTETSDEARAKRGPSAMVTRELTQVATPATQAEGDLSPDAVHLLALVEATTATSSCQMDHLPSSGHHHDNVKERLSGSHLSPPYSYSTPDGGGGGGGDSGGASRRATVIGFAFADAASARVYVGSVVEDNDASRAALGALLTQVAPQEILFPSQGLSSETSRLLRRVTGPGSLPVALTPLPSAPSSPSKHRDHHRQQQQRQQQQQQTQEPQILSPSEAAAFLRGCGLQRQLDALATAGAAPEDVNGQQGSSGRSSQNANAQCVDEERKDSRWDKDARATGATAGSSSSSAIFGSPTESSPLAHWRCNNDDGSRATAKGAAANRAEVAAAAAGVRDAALAALLLYLKRLKWSQQQLASLQLLPYSVFGGGCLRLDGQTLSNLELLRNSADGGTQGTLVGYLDSCVTHSGKRLLRRWLCHPLRSRAQIERRLDAVDELLAQPHAAADLRNRMRRWGSSSSSATAGSLTAAAAAAAAASGSSSSSSSSSNDLDRLIGRLRAMAVPAQAVTVAFLREQLLRRRVAQFCRLVTALKEAVDLLRSLNPASPAFPFDSPLQSLLLREIAATVADDDGDDGSNDADMPLYGSTKRANTRTGLMSSQLSSSSSLIREALDVLNHCHSCIRWPRGGASPATGRGSKAAAAAAQAGPTLSPPTLKPSKVGSPLSLDHHMPDDATANEGEDNKDSQLAHALTQHVALLSAHLPRWSAVADAVSQLDVLISFAVAAASTAGPTCRPSFVASAATTSGGGAGGAAAASTASAAADGAGEGDPSINEVGEDDGAVFQAVGLWHPFAVGGGGGAVVPNNLFLGGIAPPLPSSLRSAQHPSCAGVDGDDVDAGDAKGGPQTGVQRHPRAMLLTGPNMGGKSTLLRASCLAVVMAQMGCYVPAQSLTLSLADVVFTRLGASDRIMSGESTFMVECVETAQVLRSATKHSFVILDELGRGTSTFDGFAIAHAVLDHITSMLDCRLLFATHYHALTDEFASHHRSVAICHMACAVSEPSAVAAPSEQHLERGNFKGQQQQQQQQQHGELVFLYQLRHGACPKSYGLQVAAMAGVPPSVVASASAAASRIERCVGAKFAAAAAAPQLRAAELASMREVLGWLGIQQQQQQQQQREEKKRNDWFLHNGGASDDDDADVAHELLMCLWSELRWQQTSV